MAALIRRCTPPCMLGEKTRGSHRHLKPRACGEDGLPALVTKTEEYLRRESQHLQGRPVRVQGREARVLNIASGDEDAIDQDVGRSGCKRQDAGRTSAA